jgi:glycosyltransferase involved in cell wall biosynthesis
LAPAPQDVRASVVVVARRPAGGGVVGLHRLLAATACPTQLVVVDNASASPLLPALAEAGHAVVSLSREVSETVARNIGALFALSPLLVFLADDIAPAPDLAAAYADFVRKSGALAVRGSVTGVEDIDGTSFFRFQRTAHNHVWCLDTADNLAVDAPTFFRLGGYDERLAAGGDLDLSIRIYAHSRDAGTQWYCAGAAAAVCPEFSADRRMRERYDAWNEVNRKYANDLLSFCCVMQEEAVKRLERPV